MSEIFSENFNDDDILLARTLGRPRSTGLRPGFGTMSCYVFSARQPVTCRWLIFTLSWLGLRLTGLKRTVRELFALTQGQRFGACSKLITPRTGLKPFDCGVRYLSIHAPVSLRHVNTISIYGHRERDGTIADEKTSAKFCDSNSGSASP